MTKSIDAQFLAAAKQGDLEKMKTLFWQGAQIEARGPQGQSPLVIAGLAGHVKVVEWMVIQGASADALVEGDLRFWRWAIRVRNANITAALYRAGVNIEEWARDEDAETVQWLDGVLDDADQRRQIERLRVLGEAGSVEQVRDTLLEEAGRTRRDGKPCRSNAAILTMAVLRGNIPMLEMLLALPEAAMELEKGPEVGDATALQWAATGGRPEVVQLLLEAGANTETRNGSNGNTPLIISMEQGATLPSEALVRMGLDFVGVAELLYRKEASLDAEDRNGVSVRRRLEDPEFAEFAAMIRRVDGERALEASIPAGAPKERTTI